MEWVKDVNKAKQGKNDFVSQEPWGDESGKLKWGPKGSYIDKASGEYGGLGKAWLGDDVGAVLRGGGWINDTSAGVFHADLSVGPSKSDSHVGFRCTRPLGP